MPKDITIDGTLHEFSEMGGRGTPVWTIADGKNLYRLKSGDLLTVVSDAARKNVAWQGTVDLVSSGQSYPAPDLAQSGMALPAWRALFTAQSPVQASLKNSEKISF